jgi:hypothetical protein
MALARRISTDLKSVRDVYPELVELDYHKFQLGRIIFELPPAYPFRMPRFWTETHQVRWDETKKVWTSSHQLLPVLTEVVSLVNGSTEELTFPLSLV